MDRVSDQIRTLFSGYYDCYGEQNGNRNLTIKRQGRDNVTWKLKLDTAWSNHFEGKVGIGQIPIQSNGTKWGAIDLDFYDEDRGKREATSQEILKILKSLEKLPLYCFYSKTKSIHLFVFYNEPQNVKTLRDQLAIWAIEVGYPNAEIFPKQNSVSEEGTGSWINIPYFGGKHRVCLSLDRQSIKELSASEAIRYIIPIEKSDIPPCIETLYKEGVKEGSRNNFVFNIAVLYKKQEIPNWQEQLRKFNYTFFDKAIEQRKLDDTIKQLEKKNYNYNCDEQPINEYCQKELCLTRKFGVGTQSYDAVEFGQLKKILTDPARYYLLVNTVEIELSIEELMSYRKIRLKIVEALNIIPPQMKDWEFKLQKILKNVIEEEAPPDASKGGVITNEVFNFLELHSDNKQDLLRNKSWYNKQDKNIYFQSKDVRTFVKASGLLVSEGDIWRVLRQYKCGHKVYNVHGKPINAWTFPMSKLPKQQQPFEEGELPKEEF